MTKREYYKQLCQSFDNLDEMNKFLKRHKLNLKRRSKTVFICRLMFVYVYMSTCLSMQNILRNP